EPGGQRYSFSSQVDDDDGGRWRDGCKIWGKKRGVNRHLSRIPACLSAGLGVWIYGETPFMIMCGAPHLQSNSLTDEAERQSRVRVGVLITAGSHPHSLQLCFDCMCSSLVTTLASSPSATLKFSGRQALENVMYQAVCVEQQLKSGGSSRIACSSLLLRNP